MKRKDDAISEVLNQLMFYILSGIDYASKLAEKTGKSIPVVYRQLELLINKNLINKKREGKKVVYFINWKTLSEVIASVLLLDFKNFKKTVNEPEYKILIDEVPGEMLKDKDKLSSLVRNIAEDKATSTLFRDFFIKINELGKGFVNFNTMALKSSIDYFLDIFGMVSLDQQKKFLSNWFEENNKNLEMFLKICRIRYLQKLTADPRHNLIESIFKKA